MDKSTEINAEELALCGDQSCWGDSCIQLKGHLYSHHALDPNGVDVWWEIVGLDA